MNNIVYASATELARAIRAKELSSEDIVEACLKRIQEVNPKLNAVVQLTADAARAQAREADTTLAQGKIKGPLHGVPMTIKDNIETAGVICTNGTKGRVSYIPTQDATVVARLRAAGAILLGKTNLPELALAWETDNLVYGRTNNPYDVSRTPGGSSGGEAAIIASGGSPFGIGNDAGGSIRLPSHFCGITGIKPTTGRVPNAPGYNYWLDKLWQHGPMARFVEDLILILPIISGMDWRDPTVVPMPLGDPTDIDLKSLRVAYHTDNGIMTPTPETISIVKKTANIFSDMDMFVDEARPQGIEQTYELSNSLWTADGGDLLTRTLEINGTTEPHLYTRELIEWSRAYKISTAKLGELLNRWAMFNSSMLSFMEKYDVIVSPVCAYPALPHNCARAVSMEYDKAFSYTITYNLTGWPGVVVRGGTSPEGLPIGVQVVARPWCEDVALAVAQCIETALEGWKPPAL